VTTAYITSHHEVVDVGGVIGRLPVVGLGLSLVVLMTMLLSVDFLLLRCTLHGAHPFTSVFEGKSSTF